MHLMMMVMMARHVILFLIAIVWIHVCPEWCVGRGEEGQRGSQFLYFLKFIMTSFFLFVVVDVVVNDELASRI